MIPITYRMTEAPKFGVSAAGERPRLATPFVYEWHYEPPRSRFVLGGNQSSPSLRRGGILARCCGIAMLTRRMGDRDLPQVLCAYGADKPVEGPDDVVHILNLVGNYYNGVNDFGYESLILGQVCMGNAPAAARAVDRDDVVNAFWNSPVYWSSGPAIDYVSRDGVFAGTHTLLARTVMTPMITHRHWHVVSDSRV